MKRFFNTLILGLAIFLGGNYLWATPYPTSPNLSNILQDSSGNVGIGADPPKSILHVKANVPGTIGSHPAGQLIIQDPDDDVNGNAVITGYESDGSGNPDQQLWYLGSSSGSNENITLLNRRNASLTLGTNGTTRVTITADGDMIATGQIGTTIATIDVNGATTFAVTRNVINLTCTGAETINTITAGVSGQLLTLIHEDTDCTIADDDPATATDAIDLIGTASNNVGAASKVVTLVYDGSKWFEVTNRGTGADLTTANTWTADQSYDDNVNITLGSGGDADLDYDGSDVVLKTDVVGSGGFIVSSAFTGGETSSSGHFEIQSTEAGAVGIKMNVVANIGNNSTSGDEVFNLHVITPDSGGTQRMIGKMRLVLTDATSTTMDSDWTWSVLDNVNAGNANQVGVLTSLGVWTDNSGASSKRYEGNAQSVWGDSVLNKLRSLNIGRYHSSGVPENALASEIKERHISPTAEDLYDMFGVGKDPRALVDDTNGDGVKDSPMPGIAAKDLGGLALMAIQELIIANDSLKARLTALE